MPKYDITYRPERAYRPPTDQELDHLVTIHTALTEYEANDPACEFDNRTVVRVILWQRYKVGGIDREMYDSLIEPYDNGFYKKADGKSAPFGFLKVLGIEKKLGVNKDITSVRHDFDYYRGTPSRKLADKHYLKAQVGLGHNRVWAWVEYLTLRGFGWSAWRTHRKRQDFIIRYGQVEFIPELRDTKLKKKKKATPK